MWKAGANQRLSCPGRHLGLPSFSVLAGGPGSLAVAPVAQIANEFFIAKTLYWQASENPIALSEQMKV